VGNSPQLLPSGLPVEPSMFFRIRAPLNQSGIARRGPAVRIGVVYLANGSRYGTSSLRATIAFGFAREPVFGAAAVY
jgi:hypothetical protein